MDPDFRAQFSNVLTFEKYNILQNQARTLMFDPRSDKDSRDFSLMNPANMRELFEIAERTSCPMKSCEKHEKTPSDAERKAGKVDLSQF